MKNTCFTILILLFLIPASIVFAQKNVYQSEDVIKTADQIEFRYKDVLKKATKQDSKAIIQLFEFSRILDGQEVLDHALTCLELIPEASDKVMAVSIEKLNSKLKKVSLDRLLKAQERTQKEALKKPIKSWAPYTWEALNNRPVIFRSAKTANATQGTDAVKGTLQGVKKDDAKSTTMPSGSTTPKPANSEKGGN